MANKKSYRQYILKNNINKIIIGFDIDGCMAALNEYTVGLINRSFPDITKQFGRYVTIEDMINFDYSKALKIEDDERDKIFKLSQDNRLLEEVDIYPYAADVINTIIQIPEVKANKLITSRADYYNNAKEQTIIFLDKHKVNYEDNLIFDSNKVKVSKKHNINSFVEDRLKTVIELADAGIFVFMPDHYHNNLKTENKRKIDVDKEKLERFRYVENHKNVIRVYKPYWVNMAVSFSEVSDIFMPLKKYELLKSYALLIQKNGRNQKI